MHPLLFAWGAVALLLVGVRVGYHFGRSDLLHEHPEIAREIGRRELYEAARYPVPLNPAEARRARHRVAFTVTVLILATAAALLLR